MSIASWLRAPFLQTCRMTVEFSSCRAVRGFIVCCLQSEKKIYGASINSNVTGSYVRGKEEAINHVWLLKTFSPHYFGNQKSYYISDYKVEWDGGCIPDM